MKGFISLLLIGGNFMDYVLLTWNFLRSKGLNEKSTSAVMGNIRAESNFDPDVIEHGTGIGFGLCQWSYGRREQLEAYGTDFNHQLEFLWSELTGENLDETGANYQWINKSVYLSHDDFINGNGSIDDLTSAFCFCWERPSFEYSHIDYRIESANMFFTQFTGANPPTEGTHCKLLYPYWFGSNIKISYVINNFLVLNYHGNVVRIKNEQNNRMYYVTKSAIKIV
jgi:hypothetical protein